MDCKGMDRINGLSDELLVKILLFVPTKVAVSSSILSKRWEFLWMWVPKFEHEMHYGSDHLALGDFINKNLPLLKAPVLESFRLQWYSKSFQPEDVTKWVGIAVSRCIRELYITYCYSYEDDPAVLLPSSLYTCKSLVSLKLEGRKILVDVPQTVSLPSLKTLLLDRVTYLNGICFQLLLCNCPVLEDLTIKRDGHDNVGEIVVISTSLQRLSLPIDGGSSCDEYMIVTPSLKHFKVTEYRGGFSYLVPLMPKVEEADIVVDEYLEKLFESITSVKRLSLCVLYNTQEGVLFHLSTSSLQSCFCFLFLERLNPFLYTLSRVQYMYHDGIFFHQLEHLKLCIRFDYWSKLLFRLLQDSPKLRVLKLSVDVEERFKKYEPVSWDSNQIFVPECLLTSLETFEFEGTEENQKREIL